MGKMV